MYIIYISLYIYLYSWYTEVNWPTDPPTLNICFMYLIPFFLENA
jgi:hypothetical protein